jgi:hypothetical protein
MVSRLGDMFIVDEYGVVKMLDISVDAHTDIPG